MLTERPKCEDKRECFARVIGRDGSYCEILKRGYEPGRCPYCKPDGEATNKRRYPYSSFYSMLS